MVQKLSLLHQILLGLEPNCFLKHVLKYFGPEEPTMIETSPMEYFQDSNRFDF